MGILKVTYTRLSFMLHRLESHELAIMIMTIFVLPMWWILVCEMIYEIQNVYVLDV
jgi:hypothetical protein